MKIICFIFILSFTFFISRTAHAQVNYPVNATVKLSVCGNGIQENGEDCDQTDFDGQTCQSLGFASGTLNCDISCSFDTTNCLTGTPTPTPLPTAVITSVETQETPQPTITTTTIPNEENSIIQTLLSNILSFPKALLRFGADTDGKIPQSNLYSGVDTWVKSWQEYLGDLHFQNGEVLGAETSKNCDINVDRICDLKDFSVMMYYVKP